MPPKEAKNKRKREDDDTRVTRSRRVPSSPPTQKIASDSESMNELSDTYVDDVEDPGRFESQEILRAATILQKPTKDGKYIANFQKDIKQDKEDLEDLLARQSELAKSADEKFKEFMKKHIKAIAEPTRLQAKIQDNESLSRFYKASSSVHPYVEYGSQLVNTGLRLLEIYSTISKTGVVDGSKPQKMLRQWNAEREEVERLLGVGRRVAGRRLQKILDTLPSDKYEQENWAIASKEDGGIVEKVFAGTASAREGEQRLGKALKNVEKGVRRIMKNVPNEELEE